MPPLSELSWYGLTKCSVDLKPSMRRSRRGAVWSSHRVPPRTQTRFTGSQTTFPDCQIVDQL
jgi:hypothetical protein